MLAITVGGQAGAGGPEIGLVIAQSAGATYVRRLAVRRLAKRLGATVEAVSRKELSFASSSWQRVIAAAEVAFLRTGYYGADPYGSLSPHAWQPPVKRHNRTLPGEIPDAEYIQALHDTTSELVAKGDTVLVKRAGTLTLRRSPGVVHVGLFASADARAARMAHRLGVGMADAKDALSALEKARRAWFRRLGGDDPADPRLYDIVLHSDIDGSDGVVARRALEIVAEMVPGARFSYSHLRITPFTEEHPAMA